MRQSLDRSRAEHFSLNHCGLTGIARLTTQEDRKGQSRHAQPEANHSPRQLHSERVRAWFCARPPPPSRPLRARAATLKLRSRLS